MPRVKIRWLREKCGRPQDCGKCMQVCPHAVFAMIPVDRQPGKLSEKYDLLPCLDSFCTQCNLCIKGCPKNALEIKAK
nr:4Fe-4S dicluster domain-containing protein [Candidatus Njordarchaeum guaymaensis]